MQKILIAIFMVTLFSCRSEEKKEADSKTAAAESKATTLPFTATYSSSWEKGEAKNAEAVLALWKAWDDGNLLTSRKMFADSLRIYFKNGSEMDGSTDSVLKSAQMYRGTFATIKTSVAWWAPLKSTDKNENWVFICGTETSTDRQGKVDSVGLQESWRFNKDGKVDLVYQFGKALTAPAMPK